MLRKLGREKNIFGLQIAECFFVLFCTALAYNLAARLMYNSLFPFGILTGILICMITSVLSVLILGTGGYFQVKNLTMQEMIRNILSTIVILNLVFIAILYFTHAAWFSPYFFVAADTLQVGFLILGKLLFSKVKGEILAGKKALIIGVDGRKHLIMETVSKSGLSKVTFKDYRDEDIEEYIKAADSLYMAVDVPKKWKEHTITHCLLEEKDIYLVPETYEIAVHQCKITQIADVPIFNLMPYKLSETQKILKRTMDICGSLVGLILTFPIVLVVAVLIKKEDGGSIFYKQTRTGRNGNEFQVMKFRSMTANAEQTTGAVFAAQNDPRITKIGKKMRATRIDEIPQFLNVLKGDMSLIGPRPERPMFVEQFSKEIPEYPYRLAVKPGITGLAQVMGNYTTTAVNKVRFDMMYIQEYSLLLDIKIIFKTLKVICTKEQAEGFSKTAENSYDILEDPVQKSGKQRNHGLIKGLFVTACCVMVVIGSIGLRYADIAINVFALSDDSVALGLEAVPATLVTSDSVPLDGHIAISEEDMKNAMENVTWEEKMQLTYLVISRLSSDEILELEDLAHDGFTQKEKEKAKKIMYDCFNQEEVTQLYGMYMKYVR